MHSPHSSLEANRRQTDLWQCTYMVPADRALQLPVAERWLKVGGAGALGGAARVRSDAPSLNGPDPLLFAALTRTV